MRILFPFIFLIITYSSVFAGGVLVLDGFYQGKNIFVKNPIGSNGVGFCVQEVRINDNVIAIDLNYNAFEIDLRKSQLKFGDKVEVKIIYKSDCNPKILNPEVLYPKSTFEIVNILVDDNFILKWSTLEETGKLNFIIEQFRWNEWRKVGEIEGMGYPALNEYSFKVTPYSGDNQFRVKQVDYTNQPRTSRVAQKKSNVPEIIFAPIKVNKEIMFYNSDTLISTMYEVYDRFGSIIKRGFGSKIEVGELEKGVYYLYYDNIMSQFIKK